MFGFRFNCRCRGNIRFGPISRGFKPTAKVIAPLRGEPQSSSHRENTIILKTADAFINPQLSCDIRSTIISASGLSGDGWRTQAFECGDRNAGFAGVSLWKKKFVPPVPCVPAFHPGTHGTLGFGRFLAVLGDVDGICGDRGGVGVGELDVMGGCSWEDLAEVGGEGFVGGVV